MDSDSGVILEGTSPSRGAARVGAIDSAVHAPLAGIVLIDEMETGLHPSKQIELIRRLREAARDKFILATTHSETIIRHLRREELFEVSWSDVTTAGSRSTRVLPVSSPASAHRIKRDFLGGPTLRQGFPLPLLLCEGVTDKWYLEAHVDDVALMGLQLDEGEGGPEVVNHARWLANRGQNVVCLLDNDEAGVTACGQLNGKERLQAAVLPWEGTMEDLYPSASIAEALCETVSAEQELLNKWRVHLETHEQGKSFRVLAAQFREVCKRSVDKIALFNVLLERFEPSEERLQALRKLIADKFAVPARS